MNVKMILYNVSKQAETSRLSATGPIADTGCRGEAFAAGSKLCLGSGGVVKKVPAAGAQAQNVVIIGKALTPSNADGDTVEIIHHCPRAETIAAA